jgi:hypothetical protein
MKALAMIDPIELRRIHDWITEYGAPGQPCDECGLPHVEGERPAVATAAIRFGALLFTVCERCKHLATPNIRNIAERFMDRFISADAEAIMDLSLKETVH